MDIEVVEGEKFPPPGEDLPEGILFQAPSEAVASGELLLEFLDSVGVVGDNVFLRHEERWKPVSPGPLPEVDRLYIFNRSVPAATSIPLYHASYNQVLQGYEISGLIKDTLRETWKHSLVKRHRELGQIATSFQNNLGTLIRVAMEDKQASPDKWVMKLCLKEPDDSYESGGLFLDHLQKLVYEHAFGDVYRASVADLGAFFQPNKKLKTSGNTSPDLAFCGLKLNFVDLDAALVYKNTRIVWEFKVKTDKFSDAMGEVLDRSQRCRAGSGEKEKTIFGAATTGLTFQPMVILSRPDGGMVVRGPRGNAGTVADGPEGPVCNVDVECQTFREILFEVYASLYYQLRFPMKAAAEPQSTVYRPTPEHRVCGRRPEKHILKCGDGEHELEVLKAFIHSPFKGGTYLVRCASLSNELLVVKRGPCQAAQDLIVRMHGGVPVRTWNQVETELRMRWILGKSFCGISELVTYGECKSPWEWAGCPALVTKFHGDSLEATTLPLREVVEMGVALIQTVAELHRKGVYHTDISPRNITYCGERTGTDKFRLIDLGVAIYVHDGEEPRSYIRDLEFGSLNAARQEKLSQTADFESILYSMVSVAGMELPWSEAAGKKDADSVIRIRTELLRRGSVAGTQRHPHGLFATLEAFVLDKIRLEELLDYTSRQALLGLRIYRALTRKPARKLFNRSFKKPLRVGYVSTWTAGGFAKRQGASGIHKSRRQCPNLIH